MFPIPSCNKSPSWIVTMSSKNGCKKRPSKPTKSVRSCTKYPKLQSQWLGEHRHRKSGAPAIPGISYRRRRKRWLRPQKYFHSPVYRTKLPKAILLSFVAAVTVMFYVKERVGKLQLPGNSILSGIILVPKPRPKLIM